MTSESESDTAPEKKEAAADESGFWTRRVYALAAVLFLFRSPFIISFETTAGFVGGIFGGVIGSVLVAGVLKAIAVLVVRAVRWIDPR